MKLPNNEVADSNHTLLKKPPFTYNDPEKNTNKLWFSKRFFVAVLMFFGTVHLLSLKTNLHIAIVAMTSNRTITQNNETIVEKPEFDWDSKTKGFILGVFAYGFVLALFGSNIVIKIGGSTMIAAATGMGGLMALLTPTILRYNFYLYIAMRILEGTCEGLTFVSYSDIWAHWAPFQDRSKLMSIGFCGFHVGTIITFPICGYAIHVFGWPAAFYVTGGSTVIWSILWYIFVPNDPESDRWISKEELKYIKENKVHGNRPKNLLSIWKNILTSKCIWALWLCKFTYIMGQNFIHTNLPMYIKDIANVEIYKIGIYSALPNVLNVLMVPLTGYLIDSLQNKKILTPTQVHKTFMSAGYTIGGLLLISIGLFNFGFISTMLCFMIFAMILSLNFVLTQIGCICLAPKCASLVAGSITISFALASISGPMYVGYVVSNHSAEEWNLCLSSTGGLFLLSALIFLRYGSGDPQPWSYRIEDEPEQLKCTRV